LGDSTGISWNGVSVEFVRIPRKNGGNCKRGTAWGCVKYFNDSVVINNTLWLHPELTRDEAIAEIMKPRELKKAMSDLREMKECYQCGKVGIGEDERKGWSKLRYPTLLSTGVYGLYDKYIDLCDFCTKMILARGLK
jgi:hypothetical protein